MKTILTLLLIAFASAVSGQEDRIRLDINERATAIEIKTVIERLKLDSIGVVETTEGGMLKLVIKNDTSKVTIYWQEKSAGGETMTYLKVVTGKRDTVNHDHITNFDVIMVHSNSKNPAYEKRNRATGKLEFLPCCGSTKTEIKRAQESKIIEDYLTTYVKMLNNMSKS